MFLQLQQCFLWSVWSAVLVPCWALRNHFFWSHLFQNLNMFKQTQEREKSKRLHQRERKLKYVSEFSVALWYQVTPSFAPIGFNKRAALFSAEPPWLWLLMKCHHFVWRNHVARAKQNNPQAQSCGCNYRAASPSCLFMKHHVKKTPLLWSINTFLNKVAVGYGKPCLFKHCILKAKNFLEMCMRR